MRQRDTSDQIKMEIRLFKGLNLFSHPSVIPDFQYDACSFLQSNDPDFMSAGPDYFWSIRKDENICYFMESSPGNWSCVCSSPMSVPSDEGNIIYMIQEKTLEFPVPVPNPPIHLKAGANYIGIPFPPAGYTSYTMLRDIGNPEEVVSIACFDPLVDRWLVTCWGFNRPIGDQFLIRAGQGYLVFMKQEKTDWFPNNTP